MFEVAQGVQYLHSEGIVHGDLRGVSMHNLLLSDPNNHYSQSNVLLDSEFRVQIADFGLTRLSDSTATSSGAMSYHFAAPELFGADTDEASDEAPLMARTTMSDVYAFACLHYEVRRPLTVEIKCEQWSCRFNLIPFPSRDPILSIQFGESHAGSGHLDCLNLLLVMSHGT